MNLSILVGIGAGISRAGLGYLKNKAKEDTQIDWNKAAPTLIMGALIGIYSVYNGIDLITTEGILMTTGLTFIADELWRIAKKLFKKLIKKF